MIKYLSTCSWTEPQNISKWEYMILEPLLNFWGKQLYNMKWFTSFRAAQSTNFQILWNGQLFFFLLLHKKLWDRGFSYHWAITTKYRNKPNSTDMEILVYHFGYKVAKDILKTLSYSSHFYFVIYSMVCIKAYIWVVLSWYVSSFLSAKII